LMMANTPLDTKSWVAVRSPVGDDWSSATIMLILRPLSPPAALRALKRARAPLALSLNVDEALPLTEVINPIVIEVAVTPGALATFLVPEDPVVEDPKVPDVPVLVGVVLFAELPHAVDRVAKTATSTAARTLRCFMWSPHVLHCAESGPRSIAPHRALCTASGSSPRANWQLLDASEIPLLA
jgi:hypothetical protein